jgi:hypothetical protein
MDDLRQRFAALDRVPAPDVWNDVQRRADERTEQAMTGRLDPVRPTWRGSAGTTLTRSPLVNRPRGFAVLLAAMLTIAVIGAAIAVGSGLVRWSSLLPPSATQSPALPPPSPAVPTETTPPIPGGPLGGGLIVLQQDASQTASEVFSLDAGTGERTLLGTLKGGFGQKYAFDWAADHSRLLISSFGTTNRLQDPTAVGRNLPIVCCGPAGVLSPRGDRVARVWSAVGGNGSAVEISDVSGTVLRSVALPADASVNDSSSGLSWAPDESAVVLAGCSPCNGAEAGQPPTVVSHQHLFVVPVDGAPVREILNETRATFGSPAWSPDGSVVTVSWGDCPPAENLPFCFHAAASNRAVSIADGTVRTLLVSAGLDAGPLVWSPDGRQFAGNDGSVFVMNADGTGYHRLARAVGTPQWSPDGQWLLFYRDDGLWIGRADGTETRLIDATIKGPAAW